MSAVESVLSAEKESLIVETNAPTTTVDLAAGLVKMRHVETYQVLKPLFLVL